VIVTKRGWNVDIRWSYFGVTDAFLESKAAWLKEERDLHQQSAHFFRLAGKLVSLSRDDYELASLAFFQAIIGLERALRLHFAAKETDRFAELLGRAVAEEIVTDAVFSDVRPIPRELRRHFKGTAPTHSQALAILVPKLRNQFMHGAYLLSPEYLHLTFQMREIADAMKTKSTRPAEH
jgi:hypothetical protein